MTKRADHGLLKWFGHMERMSKIRLDYENLHVKSGGCMKLGKIRKTWKDGMKEALGYQEGERCAGDSMNWINV